MHNTVHLEDFMRIVTFTEFRRNASGLLDLVEKGETVRVVRHGRPVAHIVPAEYPDQQPTWKRVFEPVVVSGESLARTVMDDREERD
jgi:prevent-host-death family protein